VAAQRATQPIEVDPVAAEVEQRQPAGHGAAAAVVDPPPLAATTAGGDVPEAEADVTDAPQPRSVVVEMCGGPGTAAAEEEAPPAALRAECAEASPVTTYASPQAQESPLSFGGAGGQESMEDAATVAAVPVAGAADAAAAPILGAAPDPSPKPDHVYGLTLFHISSIDIDGSSEHTEEAAPPSKPAAMSQRGSSTVPPPPERRRGGPPGRAACDSPPAGQKGPQQALARDSSSGSLREPSRNKGRGKGRGSKGRGRGRGIGATRADELLRW